jgi:hypothetical protein
VAEKVVGCDSDVFHDLAKEHGGNIAARMIRDGGAASVWMTILHVRAALADENEAHRFQHATDLARLENWGLRHDLRRNANTLGAYELGVQLRFAVLQKHFNDFTKVAM